MAQMDGQMKTLREVRQKIMNRATPEERRHLMANHMKMIKICTARDPRRDDGHYGNAAVEVNS